MNISKILAGWYVQSKRELPWRDTLSPYKIWLSEIILQQTRVDQGLKYYINFVKTYPTIKELSNAPLDDILKLWQGLGYYSRAGNLHETAKKITHEFNGCFPATYKGLLKLKGIGPYTAAAIASICYSEPVSVVDGNVYRFLSRYYGIDIPIDSTKGKKEFQKLAESLLDRKNPGNHNQAMMEFGAIQCIPACPNCNVCPLKSNCKAFLNDLVRELPVKSLKIRIKERYFNYLVITCDKNIFLKQRNKYDIWKMLYEFPLIETLKQEDVTMIMKSEEWKKFFQVGDSLKIKKVSKIYKHILTHQTIYARFFRIEINKPSLLLTNDYMAVEITRMDKYAIPRLVERYLQDEMECVNIK